MDAGRQGVRIGQAPGAAEVRRAVLQAEHAAIHLRPTLRAKLTPTYRAGCKRILISDNFYQAVADPKTEVITEGIARVTRDGIVTVDGTEREVDAIVCATGFHVTDWYTYLEIKGAKRRGPG